MYREVPFACGSVFHKLTLLRILKVLNFIQMFCDALRFLWPASGGLLPCTLHSYLLRYLRVGGSRSVGCYIRQHIIDINKKHRYCINTSYLSLIIIDLYVEALIIDELVHDK